MEPIAIVTAFVAVLYIVGRGGLAVAPAATAAFYRRQLATPGRIRVFGGLLVLVAAALVVTARQARAAQARSSLSVVSHHGPGLGECIAGQHLPTEPLQIPSELRVQLRPAGGKHPQATTQGPMERAEQDPSDP